MSILLEDGSQLLLEDGGLFLQEGASQQEEEVVQDEPATGGGSISHQFPKQQRAFSSQPDAPLPAISLRATAFDNRQTFGTSRLILGPLPPIKLTAPAFNSESSVGQWKVRRSANKEKDLEELALIQQLEE